MTTQRFLSDYKIENGVLVPHPEIGYTTNFEFGENRTPRNATETIFHYLHKGLILLEFGEDSVLPPAMDNDRTFRDLLLKFYQVGGVTKRVQGNFDAIFTIPNVSGIVNMSSPYRPLIKLPDSGDTSEVTITDDKLGEFTHLIEDSTR